MEVTKKQRDDAYLALYKAVAKYVHLNGGSVVMAEGIQIQEWPGHFTVGIKCFGRTPTFAKSTPEVQP